MEDSKQSEAVTSENEWQNRIKEDSRTFASETSLHGIKHVGARSRSRVGRCLWLLIVLGMAGWLVFTLSSLYTRYKSYPYITDIASNYQDALPLPAISFCLRNSIQRSRLRRLPHSDIIENALLHRHLDFENETFRSILSRFTIQDVMEAGSFRIKEIIYGGVLEFSFFEIDPYFTTFDSALGGMPIRCFTFNTSDSSGTVESITMASYESWIIWAEIPVGDLLPLNDIGGMYAVIHLPWETPMEIRPINMLPGSAVNILLRRSEYRYLPAPYQSMNNRDCEQVDLPDYRSPLRHYPRYTVNNCVIERALLFVVDTCNCTSTIIGAMEARQCSLLEYYTCYLPTIGKAYTHATRTCRVECTVRTVQARWGSVYPYPSKEFIPSLYAAGIIHNYSRSEQLLRVEVRFDSTLLHITEHKPALTIDDIYSRVGGQLGLFLGASLLTITELAEHLLCLLLSASRRLLSLLWSSIKHLTGNKYFQSNSSAG